MNTHVYANWPSPKLQRLSVVDRYTRIQWSEFFLNVFHAVKIVIINILDTEEDMELESEICPSSQVTLVHQYSNLAMDSYHGYTTVYTRNHVETQVMMNQVREDTFNLVFFFNNEKTI